MDAKPTFLCTEKLPVFSRTRGVYCLFRSSISGDFWGDQNAGNPHEYLSFESLLAFFDSGLGCYQQKREIKL